MMSLVTSVVIDLCHGLGLVHGSAEWCVTGRTMWPIVRSAEHRRTTQFTAVSVYYWCILVVIPSVRWKVSVQHLSGYSCTVFIERELKSMFAIFIGRPSVCRLSSVCNVRAPYSGDWNFPQYFYAMWYLGHPRPLYKNFTEIVQGYPSVGGVKHKRGSRI